ncbi:MAG: hypothetical protein J6K61_07170 [Clostridia bacterium]|nr:hypothetical protein [Clostridia bacterium]
MADSRCSCGQGNNTSGNRETVCIDTMRVLDSCRDRDCYEDVRVFLTPAGQDLVDRTTVIRTVCADIIGTSIHVVGVPFNNGFYQINICFYIRLKLESCLGTARQEFFGLVVLEKSVVLYGGEGCATIFQSNGEDNFCAAPVFCSGRDNLPIAVVEVVSPIVLKTCLACPECEGCCCVPLPECENGELPPCIVEAFPDGVPSASVTGSNRLLVSIGLFSVIRLERSGQFLISASEYAVPDKECPPAQADEDPCRMFRKMAFPVSEFSSTCLPNPHNKNSR